MATQVHVSLEEYLATSYDDLDREYVDGAVLDRPLPTLDHSEAQAGIAWALKEQSRRALKVCTELRLRVGHDRVRIPDVCAFTQRPAEQVPSTPPLLAIEILSPDDTWRRVFEKCAEYEAWGVAHVWIVDPASKQLSVYSAGDVRRAEALEIPEYSVRITADDLG